MSPPIRKSDIRKSKIGRLHLRFFWQLILAFVLVVLLAGGGTFLAGRLALRQLESFTRDNPPAMADLWVERLATYYAQHGSWQGVESLVAGYPCGSGWGPWDEDWSREYAVTTPDRVVVAARDAGWVGRTLRYPELALASPVVVDGERVGFVLLYPFTRFRGSFQALHGFVVQRFVQVGLAIGAFALVLGLVLSRAISRPVTQLTEATRAVAAGDLSARVPERYHGEIGELAVAFNRMTGELARADELRRNLTADVAHELRTPLSVIRGKLEGVIDGVYPATPQHLEPVLEEADLLTHLVEDLRLLALAEAGQLALDRRSMDVGDLLRDAHVNFSPQAADRGVTLALDLPPELPQVTADWRRIAQVLGNLVTNALRHTPSGGCVTLSARVIQPSSEVQGGAGGRANLPGGYGNPPHELSTDWENGLNGLGGRRERGGRMVEVSVADTGTGILPDDLPYVFERFWRGEKSRSRAGGGSGLGLAIARQLVEMHGGTIGVETTPGEGSTFWFRLPVF